MYIGSAIALEGESNDSINLPTLHPPLSEKCHRNAKNFKNQGEIHVLKRVFLATFPNKLFIFIYGHGSCPIWLYLLQHLLNVLECNLDTIPHNPSIGPSWRCSIMHILFDELLILVKWNGYVTFLASVVQKDAKSLRLQEQKKKLHLKTWVLVTLNIQAFIN